MRSYILCATPRTGSTLLCDLLTATGVAGVPDSYAMSDIDPAWRAELGLPAPDPGGADHSRDWLAAVIRAGRGDNGVFGLRLMHRDLAALLARIGRVHPDPASDPARLEAAFGPLLYIHLSRGDPLAQAVSLVKARQTGLWHIAPDGREVERLSPPAPPRYDRALIGAELARLEAEDREWRSWFATRGVTPLAIRYESLAADPQGTVGLILDALGQPGVAARGLRAGVAPLADQLSRDWMARYRADTGA